MVIANVLQPLIDAEEWLLEGFHGLGLGWGLAIVALTLVVRTAIVPLTVRQFRAQRELALHLPELKRLQERHANDSERLRRELSAYYSEHRINPLAPFLPVLLQLPVFLSLYFLMREDVANGVFQHAGFLFIPDLTARPHGAVLAVLVLCYLGSQCASSAVAARTVAGKHRNLMLVTPLLFVGIATRFPAGLLVYWIVSSVWSLGQQLVLVRARGRMGVETGAPAGETMSSRWPARRAYSSSPSTTSTPQSARGEETNRTREEGRHP